MKPDILIRVRWKTTAEGGRHNPIVIGQELYRFTLLVEGEGFDCRLLVASRTLELGKSYDLPVKFLNPDLVLPKLVVGKAITLWEGKEIATGEVIELT